MAGKSVGSTARSSISSRGSPSEENAPAVPPTSSYSRGSSISGAPPPIPERSTPGPGSIGRHGSLSSVSSDLPEQPTERAPTLASVGRRDSAGKLLKYQFNLKYAKSFGFKLIYLFLCHSTVHSFAIFYQFKNEHISSTTTKSNECRRRC